MPNPIKDKEFMFTGRLSVTRAKAQELVEELGGKAGNSVCSSTDVLVVGEDYGSKYFRAQQLGKEVIKEPTFWEWVREAQEEVRKDILVTREELESGDIDWERLKRENPNLQVISGDTFSTVMSRYKPKGLPREETLSYRTGIFEPKYVVQGEKTCPHCGEVIPYSIHQRYWFCFSCQHYVEEGFEPFHVCTMERMDLSSETGFYQKCNICGNVEFVSFQKLIKREEHRRLVNYVHSAEFNANIVESVERYLQRQRKAMEPYSVENNREEFERWLVKTSQ